MNILPAPGKNLLFFGVRKPCLRIIGNTDARQHG
jgi:hypothetical protein